MQRKEEEICGVKPAHNNNNKQSGLTLAVESRPTVTITSTVGWISIPYIALK